MGSSYLDWLWLWLWLSQFPDNHGFDSYKVGGCQSNMEWFGVQSTRMAGRTGLLDSSMWPPCDINDAHRVCELGLRLFVPCYSASAFFPYFRNSALPHLQLSTRLGVACSFQPMSHARPRLHKALLIPSRLKASSCIRNGCASSATLAPATCYRVRFGYVL